MIDDPDARWMGFALTQARRALAQGEVPVGAVVVTDGRIVGRGANRPIGACDPTAHAEVVALRQAARKLGNYRLPGAQLFVTLEPCLMCLGAIIHARITRLVYGAADPRVGALSGTGGSPAPRGVNHQPAVTGGVRAAEAALLLKDFFASRRRQQAIRRKILNS